MPYARNARTHSEAQVAQLAASIREWGWTMPVLADEAGVIIAGHGRVLAARSLGITEIPVMIARGWSEAQKRAYVLADNKLALNAGPGRRAAQRRARRSAGPGRGPQPARLPADEAASILARKTKGLTETFSTSANGSRCAPSRLPCTFSGSSRFERGAPAASRTAGDQGRKYRRLPTSPRARRPLAAR